MSKKQPTEISIEDLLRALDGEEIENASYAGDPVLDFVNAFKFKDGDHLIRTNLIYKLFRAWNNDNKMSQHSFSLEFGNYFRKAHNRYWLLDADAKDLVVQLNKERLKGTAKSKNLNVGVKKYINQFKKFLEECEVKRGSLFIESDILFYVYDTWCYKNRKTPISYGRFMSLCELFFEYKFFDKTTLRWFGVDNDIKKHIDVKAVLNWRQGRKRRGKGKKYKYEKEDEKYIIYPEAKVDEEGNE